MPAKFQAPPGVAALLSADLSPRPGAFRHPLKIGQKPVENRSILANVISLTVHQQDLTTFSLWQRTDFRLHPALNRNPTPNPSCLAGSPRVSLSPLMALRLGFFAALR